MLEILGIPQPEKMTGVSLFSQVSQVAQDAKG
jgi:hypothetical protein